ncbi:ArsR/SmtB family transcription factor [Cohnella sp. JJ-181]|uniref:ArsR/SmtB family transcription factor n=1 Tax=Cohnella rhizoplanae TaxID=2974897 RepID=UPI0022FF7C51|nr:ArsR family transcriptional regulator [Cohnella sp. JJ-181]CAI6074625.1 hypothetical protein COHCIP112018_02437 [Cohnella sp. JJ-181]
MEIEVGTRHMQLLECLSSETRVRIIEMLRERPMYVKEIADELALSSAIVTKHIQKLETAGIVSTRLAAGTRGKQKVCTLSLKHLVLQFRASDRDGEAPQRPSSYAVSIPIGHYTRYQVKPTCGLASPAKLIGLVDDPRYFAEPEHVEAHHLWFGSGYVEYQVPNYLIGDAMVREIRISMEIGSEAPGFKEDWPSDIAFSLNGIPLGVWTCPGDFGSQRGLLNPDWWGAEHSQHGVLKTLLVNGEGSYIDGVRISDTTTDALGVTSGSDIRLRISSAEDARYPGGVSLYGSRFGNYAHNIEVTVGY